MGWARSRPVTMAPMCSLTFSIFIAWVGNLDASGLMIRLLFLFRGRFHLSRRSGTADLRIPRAREAAAPGLLTSEDVVIDRPLGAWHLIEHFDAVAVGVAQVDAERD